jgi:O-antigen ligase
MSDIFLISILILIFIILTLKHNEQFLLGFVIVTLFTVTNDISPVLRPFIHTTDFLILFYLFIREYGLEFSRYPQVPKMIVYFFLLFYSSMIMASVFSNYPILGLEKITRTSVFFLIVYVFYGIIRTQKHVNTVVISLFITGMILVGSVVIDFVLKGSNFFNEIGSARIRDFGLYSNFNTTAAYFIIIFPLLIIGLNYFKSIYKKILIWIGIFFLLFGLVLITSRAAFIGAFIGSIIVLFILNRKALTWLTIIAAVIVLTIFLIQPLTNFLDLALRLDEGLSQRDHFWQLAFNIIKSHPVLGIGPGAYQYEEFNYFPVLFSSWMGQRMINLN